MSAEAPTAPPPPAPNLAPPAGERGNVPGEPASIHADALGEAFADLDKVYGEAQPESPSAPIPADKPAAPAAPAKPPQPAQKQTPPKGPDGKFLPRKDEKPPEPKKDEKPPEPNPEKMAPAELRKAYQELRKKHAALEEERKKPAAAAPTEPPEDPEKQQLSQRLTEREKRLQELEDTLRFTNYERSQEYREKYEQPFLSAWKAGQDRAARLKVPEQKDELGEVQVAGRQGTGEDFNTLMLIQDDNDAADWATKTFGPAKAQLLLYHRERVQEANMAKHQALEEFKKQGGEREKQWNEIRDSQAKAVRTMYHKTVEAGIEKYADLFKPVEDDPKTKTLLEKGMRLADRALGAPDVEGEKPLTGEDRIKLQAAMRNCFGGFQNLVYQLKKERALRTELEKRVADFEASDPSKAGDGKGGVQPGAPTEPDDDPMQAFNARFGT